ncbi:MAG TPA: hypothetical protein VFQ61_00410 [Polyangiaceae bacterium]|nr:hypothetical protein [Polyangiaceae bacterium]
MSHGPAAAAPNSVVPSGSNPHDESGIVPRSSPPLRKSSNSQSASKSPNTGRPASLYAAAPAKAAQSIFGEGVMSEQSLDEVILNYLADDLDTPGQ